MRWLAAAALLWGAWSPAAARLPPAGEALVDRIVAVVDDAPVYLSDVRRILALGLAEAAAGESELELERRVLDALIDQRLRLHEVERYDAGHLPVAELERQLDEIRARFPDRAAFEARLAAVGLDEEGLRNLLAQQLRILIYVEERLGPRVFVDLEDIRAYYEGELARKAALEGLELPPLEEVREEVRALLRELRLNEEIEAWTEELRLEAEVIDLFDRPKRELPPVVRKFEGDHSGP